MGAVFSELENGIGNELGDLVQKSGFCKTWAVLREHLQAEAFIQEENAWECRPGGELASLLRPLGTMEAMPVRTQPLPTVPKVGSGGQGKICVSQEVRAESGQPLSQKPVAGREIQAENSRVGNQNAGDRAEQQWGRMQMSISLLPADFQMSLPIIFPPSDLQLGTVPQNQELVEEKRQPQEDLRNSATNPGLKDPSIEKSPTKGKNEAKETDLIKPQKQEGKNFVLPPKSREKPHREELSRESYHVGEKLEKQSLKFIERGGVPLVEPYSKQRNQFPRERLISVKKSLEKFQAPDFPYVDQERQAFQKHAKSSTSCLLTSALNSRKRLGPNSGGNSRHRHFKFRRKHWEYFGKED